MLARLHTNHGLPLVDTAVTREARVPCVVLATCKVGPTHLYLYTCIYRDGVLPDVI